MNEPRRLRKDDDLFARVVDIGPLDAEGMKHLTWRGRILAKNEPENPLARLSNAAAFICSGYREIGVKELEAAYALGTQHSEPPVRDMLASLLYFTGDYERAGELYRELMGEPGVRAVDAFRTKALECAVVAGDVDFLRKLNEMKIPHADLVLGILEDAGLIDCLAEHQRVVIDAIGQRQCRVELSILPDETERSFLFVQHLVVAERQERRDLMWQIDEGLRGVYGSKGMSPTANVGYLDFDILPMPVIPGVAAA